MENYKSGNVEVGIETPVFLLMRDMMIGQCGIIDRLNSLYGGQVIMKSGDDLVVSLSHPTSYWTAIYTNPLKITPIKEGSKIVLTTPV